MPPLIDAGSGPASHAEAITKSDVTVLERITRLYVGGAGDVAVLLQGDAAAVTFKSVPAGTTLNVAAKKVMSTNTTATDIVGLRE